MIFTEAGLAFSRRCSTTSWPTFVSAFLGNKARAKDNRGHSARIALPRMQERVKRNTNISRECPFWLVFPPSLSRNFRVYTSWKSLPATRPNEANNPNGRTSFSLRRKIGCSKLECPLNYTNTVRKVEQNRLHIASGTSGPSGLVDARNLFLT